MGRGLGWTILVQRPSGDVTYEGLPVAVSEIATPSLARSQSTWCGARLLLSRATRAFLTDAVRLTAQHLPAVSSE